MKNKRRNTIITIAIVIILLLSSGIYFFLNYSPIENGFSVLEKKWITDHANKVVDVDVYNDVPIYGYNGKGIIFDYLNKFSDEYQINFNKISYYTDSKHNNSDLSFILLNHDEKIDKHDILMGEDNYVIASLNNTDSISLNDVDNFGILKSDEEILKQYFNEKKHITVYENIEKLIDGVKKQDCSYVILSNMHHMNKILEQKLHIIYNISDLKKKLVLRVKDETFYTIMQKSYIEYIEQNYEEDYSKNYLEMYFNSTDTSDLNQKNYNAKTYRYGYAVNMPYENFVNGKFVGTISNYLSDFEKKTDVEIEVIQYTNIDDLKSALVSGEVDFALGNFDYENLNMKNVITDAIKDLNYVLLSKNEYDINSLRGLDNETISVVGSSILYDVVTDVQVKTKNYPNTNELLRSMDDQSIVLLDKETYLYYKDTKLKDYKIILEDTIVDGYKFLINEENDTFYELFNYYISTIDYHNIRYLYHTDITLDKDYTIVKIVSFIVALLFVLVTSLIFMNRKNVTNTVISKEELLKYIDPMTSLKNRNYLNMNIYKWDDNVIFPQSVVVFDVNRLREINDTYGREAGDEIIKKVASILINQQLENTDIIRSGGDEFLIYMVGYDEKQVSEYVKKVVRELKNIPDCFGIEVGYSMILDEVKTVDDAINEAIIMMTKNKEKKKTKE